MELHRCCNDEETMMDIQQIIRLAKKPAPFEKIGQPIWTDEHVAKQLLAAHLDPHTDAASRRPETIDRSVAWMVDEIQLKPGMSILDLGCGPGLYCQRLAKFGMKVTGIDFSEASVSYAKKQASTEKLLIDYRLQNYLEFTEEDRFDAALLIYGDYCALSPVDRQQLLKVVRRSLTKGGHFILDVTTREGRKKWGLKLGWYAAEAGFWSDKRHIVLEQGFDYPEELIYLDQFIVIDEHDRVRVFRNWFQDFSVDSIRKELEDGGFKLLGLYADLLGNSLLENSEWIGIVAGRN
jgi:SAM-dependent methyltransferase